MPAYTPAEIHTLFCDAFNRGDLEALLALYEPDAVLVVAGNHASGRERIREALQSMLLRRARMTLETHFVSETAQDLAVLRGCWVVEPAEGQSGLVTRGLSMEVVRKQPDGTWLFVLDNPSPE